MNQNRRWALAGCAFGSVGLVVLVMILAFLSQIYVAGLQRSPQSSLYPTTATPGGPSGDAFLLPTSGIWTATCTHRHPEQWQIRWTLVLDLSDRTFTSKAEWAWDELAPDGWTYEHRITEGGSGSISDDGLLVGEYHTLSSITWTKNGITGKPQLITGRFGQYGAIAGDLASICISRGLDPGVHDPDYIRRIGRDAFFLPGSGCEADCTIGSSP